MTTAETVLPPLPVAVPLVCAALLAALRRSLSRAAADGIAVAGAAATLCACAYLLTRAYSHTIVYWFGNWYPRGHQAVGIAFVVDLAGAGVATLAAFLTLLAVIFAWRFVDAGALHFQPLMMVFLAAMCGFALTGDLFNMFVFFELMSTAAFALCGLQTRESAPLQGAFNFAVTNTIAAFMVLTGTGLLYAITGALNLAQMGATLGSRHDPIVLFAATLLTCGFFIKAAIVPFHFWLPDAHAVAPTPVCVLFSGIMVELGLYAVLRLHTVVFAGAFAAHDGALRGILLVLGGATVLLGGVMCYAEHHLKRMLAFSTVCHAGLMLLALALRTPVAIAGLFLYLLAHALVKSGLFFCAGICLHRLRTVSEPKLFRQGRVMPWTAALWFLGGAGLAGAPPFATMLGETLTSHASQTLGDEALKWLFVAGGVLTGGAVLRSGARIFLGWGDPAITDEAAKIDELPETRAEDCRIYPYHFLPAAVCALGAAALWWTPGLRAGILLAAARFAGQAASIHTVYSGLTSPATPPPFPGEEIAASVGRGLLALSLAAALAATSVFRLRLPRALRWGAFLEGPMTAFRALQSGHPGDYVMWLTCGIAAIGFAFVFLLR